jgi:hypothetical protein
MTIKLGPYSSYIYNYVQIIFLYRYNFIDFKIYFLVIMLKIF